MQLAEYLTNRLEWSDTPLLMVGVCGRAGAGKTTLTSQLSAELAAVGVPSITYSGDWRFIRDAQGRVEWLNQKWRAGMPAYLDAINQHRWWDFDAIFKDLLALQNQVAVTVPNAYDRASGVKAADIVLQPVSNGVILYENCILGHLEELDLFDTIVVVNTSDQICLERVLKKDSHRKGIAQIVTRFMLTTYSENFFLRALLARAPSCTVACDSNGAFGAFPTIDDITHIPVPIELHTPNRATKGTIFCDLDGTLVAHVPVPSESGDDIIPLDGAIEKLMSLRRNGYHVVLTTSRSHENVFGVLGRLRALGLDCDQVICDLPVGPRHLINDSKDNEVRAFAHPLVRDSGLRELAIP